MRELFVHASTGDGMRTHIDVPSAGVRIHTHVSRLGLTVGQHCSAERTVEDPKYIPSLHRLSMPRPRMMFLCTSSGIDGRNSIPS